MRFDENTVLAAGAKCYKVINGTLDDTACKSCPYFSGKETCAETLLCDLMDVIGNMQERIRKPKQTLGTLLATMDNEDPVVIRTGYVSEYDEEMTVTPDSWFVKRFEDCEVETVGEEDGKIIIYIKVDA